jgi:aldose 1-epimerase
VVDHRVAGVVLGEHLVSTNILLEGDAVSGVLDFASVGPDLRVYDLAYGICRRSHSPLNPGEVQALPLLFQLRPSQFRRESLLLGPYGPCFHGRPGVAWQVWSQPTYKERSHPMTTAAAEETIWSGVPAIRLADSAAGTAALVAPGLGANLLSLTAGDRELLRRPPDAEALSNAPTRWGIPVLLPPGRIPGGKFHFHGRDYQLELRAGTPNHIHGFVLKRPWRVTELGPGARVVLEFRAADHPDVLSQFPHPFVFTIAYTLQGNTLRCETQIRNDGETPMPFGVGFHHYFAAPDDGTNRYAIRVAGAERQAELVDDVPSGRFVEPDGMEDLRTWQSLYAMQRDAGYMVTAPGEDGWSRAELVDRTTGAAVTVAAGPQYKHWVVFNGRPGFEGFVCLEPLTCMPNAFNLDLAPEVSGMSVVAAGENRPAGEWVVSWT